MFTFGYRRTQGNKKRDTLKQIFPKEINITYVEQLKSKKLRFYKKVNKII